MDGWEATRRIRRWELDCCKLCLNTCEDFCPHHRLPVVAVTADVVVQTRSMCFAAGMDDYITKVNIGRKLNERPKPRQTIYIYKSSVFV